MRIMILQPKYEDEEEVRKRGYEVLYVHMHLFPSFPQPSPRWALIQFPAAFQPLSVLPPKL